MVNLKSKLTQLDRNPVQLSINFNRTSQYKSFVGGTLALLFFFIAFGIICFRTLDLFQRNHREVNLNVFKENDLEMLDISSINISLRLVTQRNQPVYFEQYPSYGFEALLMEYFIPPGSATGDYNFYPLVSCENHRYACLPANLSLNILGDLEFVSLLTKESKRKIAYQRYAIILAKCDPNETLGCQEYKNTPISFYVKFGTPQVSSDGNIISENYTLRTFQTHLVATGKKVESMTFYLKRVNVLTYDTIWPQFIHSEEKPYSIVTNWFYDQEKMEEQFGQQQQVLLQIYLKRSAYTHEFTIKYDRFNKMVSEVNGMLAFVALILSCLYRGYNEWSFQQEVRKKLGILYVKPTLWNFYKSKCRLRGETDEQVQQRLILAAKLDYFKVAEQMPIIIEEEGFDINTSFVQEAQGSSNFNPLLLNRPTTLNPSRNRLSLN